jgi:hypothetical protein
VAGPPSRPSPWAKKYTQFRRKFDQDRPKFHSSRKFWATKINWSRGCPLAYWPLFHLVKAVLHQFLQWESHLLLAQQLFLLRSQASNFWNKCRNTDSTIK